MNTKLLVFLFYSIFKTTSGLGTNSKIAKRGKMIFSDFELTLRICLPGPKTLFLDRYYFRPRVCVCVCVCLSVCLSVCLCVCVCVSFDYLKKFLTDFNEIWQDDV